MKSKPANAVSNRLFSAPILAKVRKAVENYRFSFWREDGRFDAQCVELDTLGVRETFTAALDADSRTGDGVTRA